MSTVDVVIPVFNRAEAVRRAIASVLTQTHQDFEIIVGVRIELVTFQIKNTDNFVIRNDRRHHLRLRARPCIDVTPVLPHVAGSAVGAVVAGSRPLTPLAGECKRRPRRPTSSVATASRRAAPRRR